MVRSARVAILGAFTLSLSSLSLRHEGSATTPEADVEAYDRQAANSTETTFLLPCTCKGDEPVFIVSNEGRYLESERGVGKVRLSGGTEIHRLQWYIADAGDGKVVITSHQNMTLQDRMGSLGADHVLQPAAWEHWSIFGTGQDCTDVIITSHRNSYLQENRGQPLLSEFPGTWERWKIRTFGGSAACKAAPAADQQGSLQGCPIFYQTAQGVNQSQDQVRHKVVDEMLATHKGLRKMNAVYWTRDWDVITKMFKALKLPVNLSAFGNCCGGPNKHTRGQIAKWATLLLGAAWQKRFAQPCMVLLEDDIRLPPYFQLRLQSLGRRLAPDQPRMLKFGRFAEGYVLNLAAAELFLRRVYEHGIDEWCDLWTDREMKGHLQQVDIGIALAVRTGGGNIWTTPSADVEDFNYSASRSPSELARLTSAFMPEDVSASSVDLAMTAARIASSSGTNGRLSDLTSRMASRVRHLSAVDALQSLVPLILILALGVILIAGGLSVGTNIAKSC